MESPECSEFHRSTPVLTNGPPNDSGYITASPSPLCSEVYGNSEVSCTDPSLNPFIETPVVNKKGTLRKKLLQNTVFELVEESEESSTVEENIKSDYREGVKSDPLFSDDGKFLDSFCGLHVQEPDIEGVNNVAFNSSVRDLGPAFNSNEESFLSSLRSKKNKLRLPSDRLFAKKFKADEYGLATSLQSISGNGRNSLIGVTKLDFFVQLGEIGSFPGVLSLILSYLPAKDLMNICKVSHLWRKVCIADPAANQRRLEFLRHFKERKENISWNDIKQNDQGLLPFQKEVFREIQNMDRRGSSSSSPSTPISPPVSPSKIRFHRFQKLGHTLGEGTQLLPCPRCSWPSCAEPELQQARCQAAGCQYNFCLKCHCDAHAGKPCSARKAAGLPCRRRATCIGSKESRRNLRRL